MEIKTNCRSSDYIDEDNYVKVVVCRNGIEYIATAEKIPPCRTDILLGDLYKKLCDKYPLPKTW